MDIDDYSTLDTSPVADDDFVGKVLQVPDIKEEVDAMIADTDDGGNIRETTTEGDSASSISILTVPKNQFRCRFDQLPQNEHHVILTITKTKLGPNHHQGTDVFNENLERFFCDTPSELSKLDVEQFLLGEKSKGIEFWKRYSGNLAKARSKKRAPYLDVTLERVSHKEVIDTILRRYKSFLTEKAGSRHEAVEESVASYPSMTSARDSEEDMDHNKRKNPDDDVDLKTPAAASKRLNMTNEIDVPQTMDCEGNNGACQIPITVADELRFAKPSSVRALGGASSLFVKFLVALKNGESSRGIQEMLQEEPQIAFQVDPKGKLALHHAVSFSHTQLAVVERLLELHPESIKARTKRGDTALHLACFYNAHMDILEVLYTGHKEAMDVLDNNGWSPLDLAQNMGRPGPVKFLMEKKGYRRPVVVDNPLTFCRNMIQRGDVSLRLYRENPSSLECAKQTEAWGD